MTFTLVSSLRDVLSALVAARLERRKADETEREQRALAAEEARTRGTPVTRASFQTWKGNFDREVQLRRRQEEEDKIKGMTPKEREEFRKVATRFSGASLSSIWLNRVHISNFFFL